MDQDKVDRVKQIAKLQWRDADGELEDLLNENEIHNLTISRGALTPEERTIINDHIVATIDMLEQLPFPKNLKRVPEYAGGHHEKMDGTGYPRGLKRDEMSVPARMVAIADIFEALTAADRPYKKGQDAFRISGHYEKDERDRSYRSRLIPAVRRNRCIPKIRGRIPRTGSDRRSRRSFHFGGGGLSR